MTSFADTLPDLAIAPVPYPEPKTAGEVCANRLAAERSGATKRHYFPLVAPDQKAWTDLLERVARLENEVELIARSIANHEISSFPAGFIPSCSGSTVSQP